MAAERAGTGLAAPEAGVVGRRRVASPGRALTPRWEAGDVWQAGSKGRADLGGPPHPCARARRGWMVGGGSGRGPQPSGRFVFA